jgi:hypothetical protein
MSTLEDVCGVSGLGTGPGGRGCNIFRPGEIAAPGFTPTYVPYDPGQPGYNTDWNNVAPNIGVAWRPNVQGGFLRALLGDPEQATIRGGYSVSYNRPRMDEFTGLFGNNPGGAITLNRTATTGYPLVRPGETWPVLFRDSSRLGPPDFDATPSFPLTASIGAGSDIRVFDPDLEIPFTRSWSVGVQRALSRDMAVDIRYVGNRNMNDWSDENWNELTIFENGFLDEFKAAQANLKANLAAGRGGTFAYFGPGTGTSPLPTYLAFFSGVPFSEAGNASRYTSTLFRNSSWTGHLSEYDPDPYDAANDLWNNSGRRSNAFTAGVPVNWFVMNPNVDDAIVNVGRAGSKYHSLQVEVRRRLSGGLDMQGSYVYARRYGTSLQSVGRDRIFLQSAGVPHAFKLSWAYELPFGRGRRFGTDMNPVLNAVVGNWQFSGTGRFQVRDFTLNNARLVGMSESELQDVFDIRIVRDPLTGATAVFNMPQDIIDNSRRAYDVNATSPDGYGAEGPPTGRYIAPASTPGCIYLFTGDCGQKQIRVKGNWFKRVDIRLKKRFPFGARASFDLDIEVLNVFDNVNFNNNFDPDDDADTFRVTSAYTDINTTQDPGGRLGQIVWRINW